mmetsp:Transcript_36066/g.86842  ORF Transcript_36066/g.86842 Transcript_36066/m.86842 type:complete len:240 (-) Transcript_36066:38-757(-)
MAPLFDLDNNSTSPRLQESRHRDPWGKGVFGCTDVHRVDLTIPKPLSAVVMRQLASLGDWSHHDVHPAHYLTVHGPEVCRRHCHRRPLLWTRRRSKLHYAAAIRTGVQSPLLLLPIVEIDNAVVLIHQTERTSLPLSPVHQSVANRQRLTSDQDIPDIRLGGVLEVFNSLISNPQVAGAIGNVEQIAAGAFLRSFFGIRARLATGCAVPITCPARLDAALVLRWVQVISQPTPHGDCPK